MSKPFIIHCHVVTYGHEAMILKALQSALSQQGFTQGQDLFVALTDNFAKRSVIPEVNREFGDKVFCIQNEENEGFCAAHNRAIHRALSLGASAVLIFNPDLVLEPDCLTKLRDALIRDTSSGWACPKLVRADENLSAVVPRRLDATGMYFTPEFRHFDRGSDELDAGQYDTEEYVVGGSGAAILVRKEFIEDVALSRSLQSVELFDEAFFAYREDAELALRSASLGWRCRYVPSACAYHVRKVFPERRAELAAELNALGVKNRFLLQINHLGVEHWSILPTILLRNLLVVGATLLRERSSLVAYHEIWKCFGEQFRKRKQIRRRRRVQSYEVIRWFNSHPTSRPALDSSRSRSIKRLTVSIVNYNSGSLLSRCLSSLLKARNECQAEMVIGIYDNASTDSSISEINDSVSSETGVHILRAERNNGFAHGANIPCETFPADAYLILNPDVEVTAQALNSMIHSLEEHSELGAVAPVLVNGDGSPQLGFLARDFPSTGTFIKELLLLHRVGANRGYYMTDSSEIDRGLLGYSPILVEQPAAACLLLSDSAFRATRGFDKNFKPAWFEDVDLCKRMAVMRFSRAIIPSAKVKHVGGYSADNLSQLEYAEIYFGNLKRYFAKHYPSKAQIILNLAISIGLTVRAVLGLLGCPVLRGNNSRTKALLRLAYSNLFS